MDTEVVRETSRSTGSRTNSWDKTHSSKAFVYDPLNHKLSTEKLSTLDSQSPHSLNLVFHGISKCELTISTEIDNFEVRLPRWRNSIDIYVDAASRSGFVATVRLDKLGPKKNWQRRLRRNYTVLRVKGARPEGKQSRLSEESGCEMESAK